MTTSLEAMARKAGAFTPGPARNYWAVTEPALARFAALVLAQAMEDAALVLDSAAGRLLAPKRVSQVDAHTADVLKSKAAAIRAISTAEVATCKPAT